MSAWGHSGRGRVPPPPARPPAHMEDSRAAQVAGTRRGKEEGWPGPLDPRAAREDAGHRAPRATDPRTQA